MVGRGGRLHCVVHGTPPWVQPAVFVCTMRVTRSQCPVCHVPDSWRPALEPPPPASPPPPGLTTAQLAAVLVAAHGQRATRHRAPGPGVRGRGRLGVADAQQQASCRAAAADVGRGRGRRRPPPAQCGSRLPLGITCGRRPRAPPAAGDRGGATCALVYQFRPAPEQCLACARTHGPPALACAPAGLLCKCLFARCSCSPAACRHAWVSLERYGWCRSCRPLRWTAGRPRRVQLRPRLPPGRGPSA